MGGLTTAQLHQFNQHGFLPVRGLLDPAVHLDPVIREYEGVLGQLAEDLYAQGEITSLYSDLGFGEKFMHIVAETGRTYSQHFDPCLPQGGVEVDTPIWTGPAVFALLTEAVLLDAVESIIGGEIFSNPVQHVRIKPPEGLVAAEKAVSQHALGATSWHQDNGVLTPDADESDIVTVWIPLTHATERHGCLQLIPGSHHNDILVHCPGSAAGLEIPASVLPRTYARPIPMERGDVLFMHRRTAHASLSNTSPEIRWSLDLRYNPTGQPTGREVFPGFVARSRSNPGAELGDALVWAEMWREARRALSLGETPVFNRWQADAPACA
jgi:phytanoyl-CoA hydroxylase